MNRAIYRFRYIIFSFLFIAIVSHAQILAFNAAAPIHEETFKQFAIMETWVTYSMGEEKNGISYSNRLDTHLRRFRFGAKGSAASWLKYSFMFHIDRLGEDKYASTKGSYAGIGLWNAYVSAKLLKSTELLYLHTGYFWAGISREYTTKPWAVSSFDKTISSWYLRKFLTGKGNGIESGIGLGGLKDFANQIGISYRAGIHTPEYFDSPQHSAPLYTSRLMISIGHPEQSKYSYMVSGNHWAQRKGITLGLGCAFQNKIDNQKTGSDSVFFDASSAYGGDLLANWNHLTFESEYYVMYRSSKAYETFIGHEWHARMAYLIKFKSYFIEPTVMTCSYLGSGEAKLYNYIGDDITYDMGINWYLKKEKLKVACHYVIQEGTTSPNTGNYVGLSLQIKT